MWTCSDLKYRAWKSLSLNYWWALLVVLLYTVIVSAASSVASAFNGVYSTLYTPVVTLFANSGGSDSSAFGGMIVMMPLLILMIIIPVFIMLIAAVTVIFVSNPLSGGLIKWFTVQRGNAMHSVELLFYGFRKANYKHIVAGLSWRLLWTFLWGLAASLPLIIPTVITFVFAFNASLYVAGISARFGISQQVFWCAGIIAVLILYMIAFVLYFMIYLNRYYAYFYTSYILVDQPDIGYKDALKISMEMSQGQKAKMLLLDLSFIGWWLLVFLTCGLLAIALYPYLYATYTELYYFRKNEYLQIADKNLGETADENPDETANDTANETADETAKETK